MDASLYRSSSARHGSHDDSAAPRNRDMEAAGERVYRQLTPEEQEALRALLTGTAGGTAATEWNRTMEKLVAATVERRLSSGAPCDVYAVVDAVLPEALASLPEPVRAALMLDVQRRLAVSDADLATAAPAQLR
jgi:hypothetical protein